MRPARRTLLAACAATACVAGLAGPVAGASASDASIKRTVRRFDTRLESSERQISTAIEQFKSTGDPTAARSDIGSYISLLQSMRSHVRSQSAVSNRVRTGKHKLIDGIGSVITAMRHLSSELGVAKISPTAAKEQASKALTAIRRARRQLREAALLLG